MKKIIFNTSMPRSGSELFQVIIHQNPNIYGSTTSPLLEYQFGARVNYELAEVKSQNPILMENAFSEMCKYMAQGYYSALTTRPIVCDKTRSALHYYEWIEKWNPNPKMICIVRDLRSIIASMEKIYRNNKHRPIGPDNPSEMLNLTLGERAYYWIHSKPIGIALKRTLDAFQRGIYKNVLFIRYEDLTSNPENVMKIFYSYIEEPYFQHDFNNINKEVEEDDSHFGPYGSHKIAKQLKPSSENDWADIIPKEIADDIVKNNKWYYDVFGY